MTPDHDLRGLSLAYAAAVDTLDGPGFAALFTSDGELWVPDPSTGGAPTICRSGHEALARIPSGLARYRSTRHRVGTATYAVDGATATGEISGVAHHLRTTADGPGLPAPDGLPGTDTIWYLRYLDDYRLEAGVWRIARRALHLDRVEERPVGHVGPAR